jgi:hypothetical protein
MHSFICFTDLELWILNGIKKIVIMFQLQNFTQNFAIHEIEIPVLVLVLKYWKGDCSCENEINIFQVAKVLSPKRSQLVGILLSSLRVDVTDIETGQFQIYKSINDFLK